MASLGKNIVFTWWGTGWHVQPIVSLIEYAQKHTEINDKCKKLYRFWQQWWQEETACWQLQGVDFVSISSWKIRRYRWLQDTIKNIRDLIYVSYWYIQSCWYLRKHNIDLVFCKWWFVALPVCMAAATLGIDIYMHESDMHVWLVNRLVAKRAKKKFVWFPWVISQWIVVGQIMSDVLAWYDKPEHDTYTHVLVMWWSQWAASLFDALLSYVQDNPSPSFRFHVVCGTKNSAYTDIFSAYDQVITYWFLSQQSLATIYALCDLSITRWSVTSLAEQQLFSIKKIIVPLPWTWGNHQFYNAVRFSDTYNDIVVEQDETLHHQIHTFLDKLQGYKKEFDRVNTLELSAAKQTIWSALVVT